MLLSFLPSSTPSTTLVWVDFTALHQVPYYISVLYYNIFCVILFGYIYFTSHCRMILCNFAYWRYFLFLPQFIVSYMYYDLIWGFVLFCLAIFITSLCWKYLWHVVYWRYSVSLPQFTLDLHITCICHLIWWAVFCRPIFANLYVINMVYLICLIITMSYHC